MNKEQTPNSIQLSELTQDILDKALDIYYKHAYLDQPNLYREVLTLQTVLDYLKDSSSSFEWRAGNSRWLHMKFYIRRNWSTTGYIFDVYTNDSDMSADLRNYNKRVKESILKELRENKLPIGSD